MPGQSILIVDDDPICLAIASMTLRQAGYTVQSAVDGIDALERLETFQPDLILSDIQMPNMDGFELARRTRSIPRLRGIPIVALSAHSGAATAQQAHEAGFTLYLSKPVSATVLANRIRALLHRPFAPCG
jgi:chemosensory pili system protein ChpA (sensor histidine kinase/response regulator)